MAIFYITYFQCYVLLSPEGGYVVSPVGVQLRSLSIYWVRKGIFDFKNLTGLSHFFSSKCFIPRSISLGVQLILFPFIGVSKSLELFKNLLSFAIFFCIKMFYLTGGTGWTDGDQKCPLIFFILRYIKH